LGFHNPAGFTWLLQVTTLFTPDPRWAAAWLGLVGLSGLYPIYRMARRNLPGFAWLIPCILYVFLPAMVFAGRAIWPQNIMPAFGAWGLMGLADALDGRHVARHRWRGALLAMCVLSYAPLVHLSGVACLGLGMSVIGWLVFAQQIPRLKAAWLILPTVLAGAAMLPSLMDWNDQRLHPPKEKPAHIAHFEALMPPPKNLSGRMADSLGGLFDSFNSRGASSGIVDNLKMFPATVASQVADVLAVILVIAGMTMAALLLMRARRQTNTGNPDLTRFAGLLMAWIFVPILLAPLFLQRVNSTYFAYILPAVLLLAGLAADGIQRSIRRWPALIQEYCPMGICSVVAALYAVYMAGCLNSLNTEKYVKGIYYIPLAEQKALVRRLAAGGVAAGRFYHLSGEWFRHPYEYLFDEMPIPTMSVSPRWAVVEDLNMRLSQTTRTRFIEQHREGIQNGVSLMEFDDESKAREFVDTFYNLPLD
ncbi:MAG: glycosyltransferase family 39 protein, partial [Candidatus Sumerlaeaceae bacterium]|nr:glycosyltransferase family 39 protein [Candidatus Sumerlaeaceae bacterium]